MINCLIVEFNLNFNCEMDLMHFQVHWPKNDHQTQHACKLFLFRVKTKVMMSHTCRYMNLIILGNMRAVYLVPLKTL